MKTNTVPIHLHPRSYPGKHIAEYCGNQDSKMEEKAKVDAIAGKALWQDICLNCTKIASHFMSKTNLLLPVLNKIW